MPPPGPSQFARALGRTDPAFADFSIARAFYEGGFRSSALHLFRHVRRASPRRRVAVLSKVNEGTILSDMGRWIEAERLLRDALPALQRLGDGRALAIAATNLAITAGRTGTPDGAEQMLRELLEQLQHADELLLERTRILTNLADHLFERGAFEEAKTILRQVLDACRRTGDQLAMSSFFGIHAKIAFAEDEIANAIDLTRLALWHARVISDRAREASLLNNLGTMVRAAGHPTEAEALFRQAAEIARELRDPEVAAVSEMGMITVDLVSGRLEEAERRATAVLPAANALGLHHLAAQTRGNLALALLEGDRPAEALSHFEVIAQFYRAHGPRDFLKLTEQNIAECQRRIAGM